MKKVASILILLFAMSISGSGQSKKMRSIPELINTDDPGWTLVSQWIKEAKNKVEVLPKDKVRAENALYESQVTTRSPMGAVIYETGGLLIDNGWIRILGSGCIKLDREVMKWNKGKSFKKIGEQPSFLLIADDVLGGFFAINAGGIDTGSFGKVFYLAPDNLEWENLDLSYTDFLIFCFSGDIKKFYQPFYWNGWENDVKALNGNQGISCFPFLWTKEGRDINTVTRKAVPIEELWTLAIDTRSQLK